MAANIVESGQIDIQHLPVQKEDGAECLIVCGGGCIAFVRHHGQKRLYHLYVHVSRMAPAAWLRRIPADEKSHPIQAGFLGLQAIVQVLNLLAHLVEQAGYVVFVKKIYRRIPDVSTGLRRLNYVRPHHMQRFCLPLIFMLSGALLS